MIDLDKLNYNRGGNKWIDKHTLSPIMPIKFFIQTVVWLRY